MDTTTRQATAGYELARPMAALPVRGKHLGTHVRVTYSDGHSSLLCGATEPHSVTWPMDPRAITCEPCLAAWWTGSWEVLRHSGHLSSPWRHVYLGTNGRGALECYVHKHEQLVQGGLRLQRNGVLVASAWSPQRRNL